MNKIIKKIIKYFLEILFYPIKYIIPKGRIIILSTNSPYHYSGNTRYLFEYLNMNINADVYWHTESEDIKVYLKSKGLSYISISNPISFLWVLLRAKIVINDGDAYTNTFGISDNLFTVKINTGHGSNAKFALYKFDNIISVQEQINRLRKFDYINVANSYILDSFTDMYSVSKDQMISYGYPRCDQFFQKNKIESIFQKKDISRSFDNIINDDTKILLYTPTWRPYEYNLPILDLDDFDALDFSKWLEDNNYYFFYSVHSGNKPRTYLEPLSRIKYIDRNIYPLFDINRFMIESDILINDYSATTTDYSILGKAQLFCMPDYDYYWNHQNMEFMKDDQSDEKEINYEKSIPGVEVKDYVSMKKNINHIINNYDTYINKYNNKSRTILSKYYDISKTESCSKFRDLIDKNL